MAAIGRYLSSEQIRRLFFSGRTEAACRIRLHQLAGLGNNPQPTPYIRRLRFRSFEGKWFSALDAHSARIPRHAQNPRSRRLLCSVFPLYARASRDHQGRGETFGKYDRICTRVDRRSPNALRTASASGRHSRSGHEGFEARISSRIHTASTLASPSEFTRAEKRRAASRGQTMTATSSKLQSASLGTGGATADGLSSSRTPGQRGTSKSAANSVSFDKPSSSGPWLNPPQAVRYLRLPSLKALYQAVRRGRIPVHRFGKRLRFNRTELDQTLGIAAER